MVVEEEEAEAQRMFWEAVDIRVIYFAWNYTFNPTRRVLFPWINVRGRFRQQRRQLACMLRFCCYFSSASVSLNCDVNISL